MMPDRSAERLATDIEKELAEAKEHGTEGLLLTSPPRLVFTKGELLTILAALKKREDDPGPTPQMGGPHA
jgi:hypothetical protein